MLRRRAAATGGIPCPEAADGTIPHLEVSMQKKAFLFAAAALAVVAAQPAQAQRRVVRCESRDYRERTCGANTSGGVRLVRQLGDAACREGRSWGTTRGGIWVSNGCRGDFEVGGGRGGGILDAWRRATGNNRNGDWNRRNGNDGYDQNGDWNRRNGNDGYDRNGGWNGGNVSGRCRSAVASRIGTRASSVQTWSQQQGRGTSELGWRAGRSEGTCRVDRNGRVSVRVDRNNSRDWDRNRDRGRGRDRDRDNKRDRDNGRDRDHGYHN
jgi:hypothetical protein